MAQCNQWRHLCWIPNRNNPLCRTNNEPVTSCGTPGSIKCSDSSSKHCESFDYYCIHISENPSIINAVPSDSGCWSVSPGQTHVSGSTPTISGIECIGTTGTFGSGNSIPRSSACNLGKYFWKSLLFWCWLR